jgi:hypothetical protein
VVWRSGWFVPRRFKFERISAVVVVRTQTLSRFTSAVLWEEWQAGLELGGTLLKVGPITTPEGAVALATELSQLTGVRVRAERTEVK